MAESLFENNEVFSILGGGVEILQVRVSEANNKLRTYNGDIKFRDNFERGIEAEHFWLAKPGIFKHTVFGRIYLMDIRDADPFWGPDLFTLNGDIDRAMRHYILHAILEVNPELPFIGEDKGPFAIAHF